MADEAKTRIPPGADSAELRFPNGSWLQLERDTTGRARWAFRSFDSGQPDQTGEGVLTAVAAESFASLAESGTWKTSDESGDVDAGAKPAPKRKPAAKKPAAKKKTSK